MDPILATYAAKITLRDPSDPAKSPPLEPPTIENLVEAIEAVLSTGGYTVRVTAERTDK